MITENGWSQCGSDAIVRALGPRHDEGSRGDPCRHPATILNAWLAWYHRNVEDIETNYNSGERDEWGWSATNVVSDSNHPLRHGRRYQRHPVSVGRRCFVNMPPERIAKIREGLRLFEGSIYWGQDWNRRDPMHFSSNWPEWDARNAAFAKKLEEGYLGIYADEPDAPLPSPAPASGGVFWADVSQYQRRPTTLPASDPGRALQLGQRSRHRLEANARWAKVALDSGRLDAFGVYYFFRPGQANCDLHREMLEQVGLWRHPKVFTMVDVEGAGGQIRGNHTVEINDEVQRLQGWYGDKRRVIGYLNPKADPACGARQLA
ncbi:hypothetical protein GS415_10365 [Rhodococcus hoagii]|nr:hypothetical protein [Prescottella equi]